MSGPVIARVIDYETTGMVEDVGAEVIEMGRIDVDLSTGIIGNSWSSLVKPIRGIPAVTKAVHHIIEDDVADAPLAADLWAVFFDGCGEDDVLVAHNAKFEQHFHAGNGRPWICTYKVACVVWPDAPSHGDQALRYWLDLALDRETATPAHRALPDAYVTAHIFKRLLDHKTVDEMIHISKYPALKHTFTFGKHRGMKYADAPADYLQWLCDKSDMGEDVKFSAKYWLKKRD